MGVRGGSWSFQIFRAILLSNRRREITSSVRPQEISKSDDGSGTVAVKVAVEGFVVKTRVPIVVWWVALGSGADSVPDAIPMPVIGPIDVVRSYPWKEELKSANIPVMDVPSGLSRVAIRTTGKFGSPERLTGFKLEITSVASVIVAVPTPPIVIVVAPGLTRKAERGLPEGDCRKVQTQR